MNETRLSQLESRYYLEARYVPKVVEDRERSARERERERDNPRRDAVSASHTSA